MKRWRGLKSLVVDAVEHGSRAVEKIQIETMKLPFALLEQVADVAPDRLRPLLADLQAASLGLAPLKMPQTGLVEMVVNGSCEEDWPQVAVLARQHAWIRPAFGLHPWYVKERGPRWLTTLRSHLEAHPSAVVGEIGLDRWIENPDIAAQLSRCRPTCASSSTRSSA